MTRKTKCKRDEFVTIRVSKQLKARLQTVADECDRPLSWIVNNVLEEHFSKEDAMHMERSVGSLKKSK